MSLPKSVADVIDRHVTFQTESIDRMYLNVYQPMLQTGGGVSTFFRGHRGEAFATAKVMAQMTRAFVASIERFARQQRLPITTLKKGVRKEEVFQQHLARFPHSEGVVLIVKAQEKANVYRTIKKVSPETGKSYPWLMKSTAMVNHYYFYCVDKEFGPFFIKFCSYFPYNAKMCINGHEYAKRQLEKRGIGFDAPDNAVLACDDPPALQRICDGLSSAKIDALLRRWLKRLPSPFTAADHQARFRYELSMLQTEFSLTQVLDRPLSGRVFFEQVIRENLDLGRPRNVQLIFDRRVIKTTPSRFRTRVITQGVIPSLWIDDKLSTIKQYFKQGRALRTETTVNNTRDFGPGLRAGTSGRDFGAGTSGRDFGIGRKIENLTALREMAFAANRRLLHVQQLDRDPTIGQDQFDELTQPAFIDGQRVSGLKFGDPVVLAVLSALLIFRLLPRGFSNRDLRDHVAQLLTCAPAEFTPGRMSYQLRRLRLKGLIQRIPKTHRYEVSDAGLRAALFYTATHSRTIRPLGTVCEENGHPLQDQLLKSIRKTLNNPGKKSAA